MDLQALQALGMPGLFFGLAHVGLTQILRQVLRWNSKPIQDQTALLLSLVIGALLGVAMLSDVAAIAGIKFSPPFGGLVMGIVFAASNSGLIAKYSGIQKDGARYQAEAAIRAAQAVNTAALAPGTAFQQTTVVSYPASDAPSDPEVKP